MKLTPYISTLNSLPTGEARSITVSFVENRTKVHYRLGKKGITSVKTQVREASGAGKMFSVVPSNTPDVYEKKADELVFLQTGKTRWLREGVPVPLASVSGGAETIRDRLLASNQTRIKVP